MLYTRVHAPCKFPACLAGTLIKGASIQENILVEKWPILPTGPSLCDIYKTPVSALTCKLMGLTVSIQVFQR